MAAPTPTARIAPTGIMMDDGFPTKITFSLDPNISIWEKTVTPPGLEMGDMIPYTTMHNTEFRTFRPRVLKTLTTCSLTVGYDPDAFNQIEAILGLDQTITVTFYDGSTYAFYGVLNRFIPGELADGEEAEAECEIEPTNYDASARVEAGPVLTSVAGS